MLLLIVALTVGVVLPGAADWLSRRRDAALAARIAGDAAHARPPRAWSFEFDGRRYECSALLPFDVDQPAYRCTPADKR